MIFYIKNSKNAHSRAKHVKNAFLYEIVILSVKRLQTSFQRKEHYFLKTCDFNFTFVLMLSHCLLNATYFWKYITHENDFYMLNDAILKQIMMHCSDSILGQSFLRYKGTFCPRMMIYYKNAFFKNIALKWAFLEFLIQNHFRSFHFTKEWYNVKNQIFLQKEK